MGIVRGRVNLVTVRVVTRFFVVDKCLAAESNCRDIYSGQNDYAGLRVDTDSVKKNLSLFLLFGDFESFFKARGDLNNVFPCIL